MAPYKFPLYSARNRINMRVPITAAVSPRTLILRGTQGDPLSRSVVTDNGNDDHVKIHNSANASAVPGLFLIHSETSISLTLNGVNLKPRESRA